MDLILASAEGKEEGVIFEDVDMDCGSTNDFQISMRYAAWTGDITFGKRIYIPDTEYGGIVKAIEGATKTDSINVKGWTWRGYLERHYIIPPAGQDYYAATGELNDIIRDLIQIPGFTVLAANTGVNITEYQFKRYCTVLDGLTELLSSVGYRLDLKYKQTQAGGYVQVQALPAVEHSRIYMSQDSDMDFISKDDRMGVNHLICLGSGELRDRIVVHLYADGDGNVSQTQEITGIDEICETFENTNADQEELIKTGTARLKERMNSKSFEAALKDISFDPEIGDTITGQDYITGNIVTKPITRKIIKITGGIMTITNKIEGET